MTYFSKWLSLKINVQPLLQKKGLRGQDPILANQDQNQLHYQDHLKSVVVQIQVKHVESMMQ